MKRALTGEATQGTEGIGTEQDHNSQPSTTSKQQLNREGEPGPSEDAKYDKEHNSKQTV